MGKKRKITPIEKDKKRERKKERQRLMKKKCRIEREKLFTEGSYIQREIVG